MIPIMPNVVLSHLAMCPYLTHRNLMIEHLQLYYQQIK